MQLVDTFSSAYDPVTDTKIRMFVDHFEKVQTFVYNSIRTTSSLDLLKCKTAFQ